MLSTMLFGDEVNAPERLDELDGARRRRGERARGRDGRAADRVALDAVRPERYRDEYRERVLDLIERKAAGEEIAVAADGGGAGRRCPT